MTVVYRFRSRSKAYRDAVAARIEGKGGHVTKTQQKRYHVKDSTDKLTEICDEKPDLKALKADEVDYYVLESDVMPDDE